VSTVPSSTAMVMPQITQAPQERPWVLVVDDSRVVRHAVMRILEKQFNLVEADDGWAGLRYLRDDSRIEAVITDIQMPNLDGYSLICKIRAADDPGMGELPVVVITSSEDDTTRERAYACGADDFILKPFNALQLKRCLAKNLKDYQAETVQAVTETATAAAQQVPSTKPGNINDAVAHFDAGLQVLRSLKTPAIAPHALLLTMRLLSLLKYCNSKFNLGLDREIATVQERLTAARESIEIGPAGTH